jgi:hypothetical protein
MSDQICILIYSIVFYLVELNCLYMQQWNCIGFIFNWEIVIRVCTMK